METIFARHELHPVSLQGFLFIVHRTCSSRSSGSFLFVSLRARRQVLQRLSGLRRVVVACRGLDDALLPSAVVFGGEMVPPTTDSWCCRLPCMVHSVVREGALSLFRMFSSVSFRAGPL